MSERGIVEQRQLVAIQTFDVARLTTHAVEIIPGKFIAISGVGPKGDSNGSGKTSFLVAVSIVLADPQWRLDVNGGKFASGVLFKPDAAGIDPALKVTAAPYGYVVAVFTEPTTPIDSALTVWVRIASEAPYVQARWVGGIHVPDASSEDERALQADALWQALPADRTISAKRMAEELYGDAPRCLTYLDTSLRPRVPSLLSQQMTEMQPDEIGGSLIALAGLTSKLDEEERQRGEFLDQRKRMTQTEKDAEQAWKDEEAELAAVDARESARAALTDAESRWRLYLAKQYLHVLGQDRSAAELTPERTEIYEEAQSATKRLADQLADLRMVTDLTERERQAELRYDAADGRHRERTNARTGLDTRKSILIEERNGLLPQTERWNGLSVQDAERNLDEATAARSEATGRLDSAEGEVDLATKALQRAQDGRAGRAGALAERLAAAGVVGAAALTDIVEVDEAARAEWEPRLWPWRDAVVVPAALPDQAHTILTEEPGAQIVIADSPADASSVLTGISYPAGLHDFLTSLQERLAFLSDPPRVSEDVLHSTTFGGFTEPTTGRDAHVRQARAELREAETRLELAQAVAKTGQARWLIADGQHAAATAAARLAEIAQLEGDIDEKIAALDTEIAAALAVRKAEKDRYEAARDQRVSHGTLIALAEAHVKEARRIEADCLKKVEDLRASREKLAVEAWRREWDSDEEQARLLLEAAPDLSAARPQTLLRRASELLKDAMRSFLTDRDDVPEDIAHAARQREQFAEQSPHEPPAITFAAIASPLTTRLDGHADRDLVTRARIETLRTTRRQAMEELRIEVDKGGGRLDTLQGMIERHIEGILRNVSQSLNRLSLYGAELQVVSMRPEGAAGWRWEVTPKWRRSRSGGMVPYQEVANGAQVKVFAIQLVLAALLADTDTVGRVLILDELGNSLGEVNRKEVLGNLHAVAELQQVTIFGTCQDSVLPDAADHFGELIWFTHATTTDSYNQPTRMWGHDENGERVELTADWLTAGRAHV